MKQQENVNQTRHLRQLTPGETVFRKMPSKARPAKHPPGEPSAGPYVVVRQSTHNSVQLKNPATGLMVDEGVDIPLEQILASPKRGRLSFEVSNGDRSIGQMISGQTAEGLTKEVQATGYKSGVRKGWKGLHKGEVVAYRLTDSK